MKHLTHVSASIKTAALLPPSLSVFLPQYFPCLPSCSGCPCRLCLTVRTMTQQSCESVLFLTSWQNALCRAVRPSLVSQSQQTSCLLSSLVHIQTQTHCHGVSLSGGLHIDSSTPKWPHPALAPPWHVPLIITHTCSTLPLAFPASPIMPLNN